MDSIVSFRSQNFRETAIYFIKRESLTDKSLELRVWATFPSNFNLIFPVIQGVGKRVSRIMQKLGWIKKDRIKISSSSPNFGCREGGQHDKIP